MLCLCQFLTTVYVNRCKRIEIYVSTENLYTNIDDENNYRIKMKIGWTKYQSTKEYVYTNEMPTMIWMNEREQCHKQFRQRIHTKLFKWQKNTHL